ncbi:BREX system Lon protease-like protein BrxL [bacterium]|nr:BREX system Lon protease-like protein BrxL [bacterium]
MESELELKIKKYFDGMIVKKQSVKELFSTLSIPAFLRDWFLKKYSDKNGLIDAAFVSQRLKSIMPKKEDWNTLLDTMVNEEKFIKVLTKIVVNIDIKNSNVQFSLPNYGIGEKQTYIPPLIWKECKDKLLSHCGTNWGVVELCYKTIPVSAQKNEGKICLASFMEFCPYKIDLNYYKKSSKNFTLSEWIEILLGAIDYKYDGFENDEERLSMLTRLLPFVEKRLNIIELAPKGTGKSYVYSQISKRGWLASGGVMTRAKMFYDMQIKSHGLVGNYDYVALDEIATIKFPDVSEMQGALKGYLESGAYTVGIKQGYGDAGIVLLGNIRQSNMDIKVNMLEELPPIFKESALVDRFHGFIEGWKIPRMNENLKIDDWALNSEYISEIMHELREDITYKALTDKLIDVPDNADTRDTNAVKRITTAYVKLLFPYWSKSEDVDMELFDKFCLKPAIRMRGIIKKQLSILDNEYKAELPDYKLKFI